MPPLFGNSSEEDIDVVSDKELPILDESITDVNKSASYIFFERNRNAFAVGVLAGLAWEGLISYILYSSQPLTQNDPRGYLFFALALPPVIFIGIYNDIKSKLHHEFMQQFALANNYTYQKTGTPQNTDGSLFSLGHDRAYQDLIGGVYRNKQLNLFNFIYVTGSGKSQQTHSDTIFQIEIGSPLPKILLLNIALKYAGLVSIYSGLEKLTLEGDFSNYFSLYCNKGFEDEVLEIFSPDFMEQTKDNFKEFSIEFINSRIYIYYSSFIETKDELQKMYNLVQYIINKIDPLLERMKGDIVAMNLEYSK